MKRLMCVIILLISGSTCADESLPPQTISRIETGWGSEAIYVQFVEKNYVESCTDSMVRFSRDHPMLKDVLSIALSAFHAGKKVQVRVSGCVGARHNGTAIAIVQ
ncbi:hypothetical protein L4D15_24255 [Enterovibrio norvegicus]|uniref:hypothetical protein n=1 Tax=Enterovibrio norvegicus TaxID=188144 RepID=UPI003D0FADCE